MVSDYWEYERQQVELEETLLREQREERFTEKESDMPKLDEMFGGSYLKAGDLNKKRHTVKITGVRQQIFQDSAGGEETKWVLELHNPKLDNRGLVLNKTNANLIAMQHGSDTDDWIDKSIKLYPTTTDLRGELVACIRVWNEEPVIVDDEEVPF